MSITTTRTGRPRSSGTPRPGRVRGNPLPRRRAEVDAEDGERARTLQRSQAGPTSATRGRTPLPTERRGRSLFGHPSRTGLLRARSLFAARLTPSFIAVPVNVEDPRGEHLQQLAGDVGFQLRGEGLNLLPDLARQLFLAGVV